MKNTTRRVFVMQLAAAGSALGAAAAHAQAAPAKVDEKDPQAVALGYVADATKADVKDVPATMALYTFPTMAEQAGPKWLVGAAALVVGWLVIYVVARPAGLVDEPGHLANIYHFLTQKPGWPEAMPMLPGYHYSVVALVKLLPGIEVLTLARAVTALTLAIVAGIVLAGHFLTRPVFRFVHASRLPEMSTFISLLIVFGMLMAGIVGLNMWLAYRFRPVFRLMSPEQASLERYRMALDPLRRPAVIGALKKSESCSSSAGSAPGSRSLSSVSACMGGVVGGMAVLNHRRAGQTLLPFWHDIVRHPQPGLRLQDPGH